MLSFVIWLLRRCWRRGTWMGEVMGELGWYLIRETTKANGNMRCHLPCGWEFISERVIRGGSTDLPGLEWWQMTRHRRSLSGFHVAIGDVAPQITVAVGRGQVCGGCSVVVVVVPWCESLPWCRVVVVLWSWLTGWVGRKVGGGTYHCVNINKNYERQHCCRSLFGTFHSITSMWASIGDMALPCRCCCGGCGATDVEGSGR